MRPWPIFAVTVGMLVMPAVVSAVPCELGLVDATPAPRASWHADLNKACYHDACFAPGKRFTADVMRRGSRSTPSLTGADDLDVALTLDHKLGVISGPFPEAFAIWDIAKDAPLVARPPAEHPNAQLSVATVVGNGIVIDWNDGTATVLAGGGPVGASFRAGLVVPLDEARAAMISWTGSVSTIDMATGKIVRTDSFVDARIPFDADLVRLGSDDVALTWNDDHDGTRTMRIHLPATAAATAKPGKCD